MAVWTGEAVCIDDAIAMARQAHPGPVHPLAVIEDVLECFIATFRDARESSKDDYALAGPSKKGETGP